MKTLVIAAAALALCAGCASTATPSAQISWVQPAEAAPQGPEAGTIVVIRDSGGGTGMQGCGHRILLDGRQIAELMPGQGVKTAAPAGSHVLHLGYNSWLCNTGESALNVSVSPGAATYVRTMTSMGNLSVLVPSIAP